MLITNEVEQNNTDWLTRHGDGATSPSNITAEDLIENGANEYEERELAGMSEEEVREAIERTDELSSQRPRCQAQRLVGGLTASYLT